MHSQVTCQKGARHQKAPITPVTHLNPSPNPTNHPLPRHNRIPTQSQPPTKISTKTPQKSRNGGHNPMNKTIKNGLLLLLILTFSALSIIGLPINKKYTCTIETTIKKDVIYKTGVLELNGQLKYNIIMTDWYLVGSINLDDERMNMRVSGNEKNDLIGIVDTKRSKIHSTSQVTIMTLFDHYGKGKIFNDHVRIVFPAGDM